MMCNTHVCSSLFLLIVAVSAAVAVICMFLDVLVSYAVVDGVL
jgi:hypothetical protein